MANGTDATAQLSEDEAPFVLVLHTPPQGACEREWALLVEEARTALSQGRVVAVLGHSESEPLCEWSEETLCRLSRLKPDGGQIEWQCEHNSSF
jgi:hypothetical protein